MKVSVVLTVCLLVFCSAMTLLAADSKEEAATTSRPTARRAYVPRPFLVESPEVHPDRRITFRLRAPQAKVVEVKSLFFKGKAPREAVWELMTRELKAEA